MAVVDPLSKLLSGIRAEGSVLTHAVLPAPWTIRFADRAPLTMITVLRGGGTLLQPDGGQRVLGVGDTALVRGPDEFRLVSIDSGGDIPEHLGNPAAGPSGAPPARPAEYEISCCTTDSDCEVEELNGINWGSAADATALLVGVYRTSSRRHDRLLRALPPVLVVYDDMDTCAWFESAAAAAVQQSAGSQAMMDRLLDWSLVCTMRSWFDQAGPEAPTWFRGLSDPVVAPALHAIHTTPGAPWTVATLAAESQVSRALFAKRFTAIMGQPPLTYLTITRMDEAEELLTETDLTIAQLSKSVGYAAPFGFSAAFKRHRGVSPTTFRTSAA
ncbi:helix-turn-helix domain-containing protein [Nocardia seriolae]|nr:helix-turn-helix domain-containing protein [Nocardia seriolae]GEM28288.1 cupin [Nocardia seriolae NBRC 15557]MTJ75746.1 helix-turn-helix domain-containing protein [Nocardia seriolae]MTJ90384.1 helix-turn-helix domain-containing protein [Nocardia seriolae]MTK34347.1 helix-turn-helix domain-containing protein [Nocardia seriolae]